MCYEDKVEMVASVIAPHVKFDSVDEAKEFMTSYRHPDVGADRQVQHMARHFARHADHFGLSEMLATIGGCIETRRSALREAIRLCAKRHVEQAELKELVELGVRAPARSSISTATA